MTSGTTQPAATMLARVLDDVMATPAHRAAGLRLVRAQDGACEIHYDVNEFTANMHGKLHGGFVCLMHDVADFIALSSLLPAEKHAVTADTQTSILRPANRGDTIIVRARVDRAGRTLAFMRCESFSRSPDGTEKLIATGALTKAIVAA